MKETLLANSNLYQYFNKECFPHVFYLLLIVKMWLLLGLGRGFLTFLFSFKQGLWMHLDVCNEHCGWHAPVFWIPMHRTP